MIGSWIGAIILPSLLWLIFYYEAKNSYNYGMAILPVMLLSILLIPIGFLIGWGLTTSIKKA